MRLNLPSNIRKILYVITAIGTPIVSYFALKGTIGDLEVALWTAEVSVVSVMAAFNVTPDS